jgi:hypothetical protein
MVAALFRLHRAATVRKRLVRAMENVMIFACPPGPVPVPV